VDHVDDQANVLIRRRLFFGEPLPVPAAGDDALLGQFAVDPPAPWQVVPKVRSMLAPCPTRTQLARPMSPGMITGWPIC
jgi:hypothetical protein